MIPRYTDHSANERTYLAWIRTAISIMAFGFIIEKFDLFIAYLVVVTDSQLNLAPNPVTKLTGLALFLVGTLMIVTATVRFFTYKKAIESELTVRYSVKKTTLVLSSLMSLVALVLFIYMSSQFISA